MDRISWIKLDVSSLTRVIRAIRGGSFCMYRRANLVNAVGTGWVHSLCRNLGRHFRRLVQSPTKVAATEIGLA